MKKLLTILLTLFTLSSFGQFGFDKTYRRVRLDTLRHRTDSIYIPSPIRGYNEAYFTNIYKEDTSLYDFVKFHAGSSVVSFGADGQVPYMNPAGTDYIYSPNFSWRSDTFFIKKELNVSGDTLSVNGDIETTGNSFRLNQTSTGYIYLKNSTYPRITGGTKISLETSVGNTVTFDDDEMILPQSGAIELYLDATIAGPQYRFRDDDDLGVGRIAADELGIYTNGNTRVEITNDTTHIKNHVINDSTLQTGNPKFYAAFADSSEVIAMTQNVYSHITGTTGELFTSYREEHGFTFQNDSVQIPPNISGWYEIKYSFSFQGTASDVYHTAVFVDNAEITNRANRERSTSNNAIGSCSGFLDYEFSGGEWVKLMIKNTGDNDDATMVSGDWSVKYDE